MEIVLRGRPQAFDVTLGTYDSATPTARAALAARQRIVDEFYNPSLARRVEMAGKIRLNEANPQDMPQDLLALIATGADPAWLDPAMGEREALFLLAPPCIPRLQLSFGCCARNFCVGGGASDAATATYRAAVHSASNAGNAALASVVPGFPRLATADVILKSGTEIPADAIAILRSGPANTDRSTFGEDSLEFDPDREIRPGINRFGLAFGMGTHMCFGMPIVMGTGGMDGSLVYLLKKLLDAAIEPDESSLRIDLPGTRGPIRHK